MTIRDRILELRRVKGSELLPHPRNWRLHPPMQQQAVRTLLERLGYAQALLARETAEGKLEIIDGHLRAELTPDELVPVLVLDVDPQEALELLATLNPLAGLAETDEAAWEALSAELVQDLPQLQDWLSFPAANDQELINQPETKEPAQRTSSETFTDEQQAPEESEAVYQVIVTCRSETEQRQVFETLRSQGHACRLLVL